MGFMAPGREHSPCSGTEAAQSGDAEAKAAGYKALAITVDSPRLGKREADERNK